MIAHYFNSMFSIMGLFLLTGCHVAPEGCRCELSGSRAVSRPPVHQPLLQNASLSKGRLPFDQHYSNFGYPGQNIQLNQLAEYFQNIDHLLLRQSVDCTLREMSYMAMQGNIIAYLTEAEADDKLAKITRENAGRLLHRWQMVRSLDNESMPAFIRKAMAESDVDAICIALSANWPNAPYAIEALRRLNDERTVPSLALYLNSLIGVGGPSLWSELNIKSQKEALYSALFAITGIAPPDFHDTREEAVNAYLAKVEHWFMQYVVLPDVVP